MSKLIPISQLLHQAKLRGINLGSGHPKTHLTYLSEIGLLPPAIRRKNAGSLEGHYPIDALDTLEKIESLKSQGLSYHQIKNQLNTPSSVPPSPSFSNSLAFLLIGLILGYLLALNRPTITPPQPVALDKTDQSLYLISIPKEKLNFQKIGTIELK